MMRQWGQLKETISEIRDNANGEPWRDLCTFLVSYMEVLEKEIYMEALEKEAHEEE